MECTSYHPPYSFSGADPTVTNEYRLPPADYARDVGMRKLMQQHMALYSTKQNQREVEERRRFPIEQRIRKRIIGQEGAIATVCGAIRRKENGWLVHCVASAVPVFLNSDVTRPKAGTSMP